MGTFLYQNRFCPTNGKKMAFLSINMAICGGFTILMPLVDNFGVLVVCRLLQNVSLGAYITADASLVVYTLGPIKSRPFTFALHSVIGKYISSFSLEKRRLSIKLLCVQKCI